MDKRPGRILEDIIALKRSALFSAVATRELEAVAAVAEEVAFEDRDTIVREGEVGDSLYLIKSGGVTIVKRIGEAAAATLAELGPGECFGEMTAIDEEVRSASVIATGHCALLRISKDALLDAIRASPDLGVELLRIFVKRLRASNERIQIMTKAKDA